MNYKCNKFLFYVLILTLVTGIISGSAITACADDNDPTYTITIPSTLTVQNIGWNALDGGISVDLASGKELVVTASSNNNFNFVKSGDSSATVAYYFLESGDANTSYDLIKKETSWDFTESEQKNIGIVVEDYSTKPAGTYTETVTFTASVEDAAYTPKTFTSLSDGDVLRVGDTLEVASGEYIFPDDGCSLMAWNAPFTVLRANVEGINDPSRMPTVTEDANGTYYVIKGNENNYFDFSGKLVATDTSDGVKITKNGDYWAIAVNEP